jgi:Ser/Thr protein kinase RdoA (MazF antagonist)
MLRFVADNGCASLNPTMLNPPGLPLSVRYSTANAAAVAEFVAATYALPPPVETALLIRGFNDTFEVHDGSGGHFLLRLSSRRPRGEADVAAETEFLTFLDGLGVPVAVPVAASNGQYFSRAMLPEGGRPAVLFRHAEGRAPKLDEPADAWAQGITLARIHEASTRFASVQAGRYRLDLDHLMHRQVAAICGLAALRDETRERLIAIATRLAEAVASHDGLSWTRCHGDCHGFNARIVTEGPRAGEAVLFDFDDGGYGYLAYDLAVHLWAQCSFGRRRTEMWHAFIRGYRSVREIAASDFDATHLFVPIRHIWLIGEYAGRTDEWGTQNIPSEWLEREVTFLETWQRERITGRLF